MDLTGYKLPKIIKGRDLKKAQRLALEIIEFTNSDKTMAKRWFQICKKYPAFVEDRFNELKRKDIKSGAYLFRMIFPKKVINRQM